MKRVDYIRASKNYLRGRDGVEIGIGALMYFSVHSASSPSAIDWFPLRGYAASFLSVAPFSITF